MSTETTSSWQL